MKKIDNSVLDVHVLIEEKSKGFRAHCLEFDLAISAGNEEQAMVRMEQLIDKHLLYGFRHGSNPIHKASDEVCQRWFSPNCHSPLKSSYILSLEFKRPKQDSKVGHMQRVPKIVSRRRSRENLG